MANLQYSEEEIQEQIQLDHDQKMQKRLRKSTSKTGQTQETSRTNYDDTIEVKGPYKIAEIINEYKNKDNINPNNQMVSYPMIILSNDYHMIDHEDGDPNSVISLQQNAPIIDI